MAWLDGEINKHFNFKKYVECLQTFSFFKPYSLIYFVPFSLIVNEENNMSIEHELRMLHDGANIHIINKTLYYLNRWKDKYPLQYKKLSDKVETAIQSNDWKDIKNYLGRYW